MQTIIQFMTHTNTSRSLKNKNHILDKGTMINKNEKEDNMNILGNKISLLVLEELLDNIT